MEKLEFEVKIKLAKRLNKRDRLEELQSIAQDIATDFQDLMADLEVEVDNALDNTGERIKNELGWHSVADLTQSIDITPTWMY